SSDRDWSSDVCSSDLGGSPLEWAVRLARAGLLVSLVNASTTALVAASAWLRRYDRRRSNRPWASSIPAALVVGFGVQIALGLIEVGRASCRERGREAI